MGATMGFKGKLYVKISGTDTLVPMVGDVQIIKKADEVEASCREGSGTKAWAKGLKEFGCTFNLQKRKANSVYNAIRDAWRNDTTLVVTAADGLIATTGTDMVVMECEVFDFGEAQPINGVMAHNVVLKPSVNAATPPAESTAS